MIFFDKQEFPYILDLCQKYHFSISDVNIAKKEISDSLYYYILSCEFPLILDISKEIKFSDIRDEFGLAFTDINGCCETAKWRVHGAYSVGFKTEEDFLHAKLKFG